MLVYLVLRFCGRLDEDDDGLTGDADCDDRNARIGARELMGRDEDLDGWAASAETEVRCPGGRWSPNLGDCDDDDATQNPDALDDGCDCSGQQSPDSTWYADDDGDGFGGSTEPALLSCASPGAYVANGDDCDDSDPTANPDGVEQWYDGVDQDCDGNDRDADGDGQDLGPDCDDEDARVYPGATETCNGVDDDCDTLTDADDPGVVDTQSYEPDTDGDGWGDGAPVEACEAPTGYAAPGDCDDGDSRVAPDAVETCGDGLDTNCILDCGPGEDLLDSPWILVDTTSGSTLALIEPVDEVAGLDLIRVADGRLTTWSAAGLSSGTANTSWSGAVEAWSIGDLDRDGEVDLLVEAADGSLVVLDIARTGSAGANVPWEGVVDACGVVVGDGGNEAWIGHADGTSRVRYRGNLKDELLQVTGTTGVVTTLDLDGDGQEELLTSAADGVWALDSSLTGTVAVSDGDAWSELLPTDLVPVGDLDGDGLAELVLLGASSWVLSAGGALAEAPVTATDAAWGDLDADGAEELILATEGDLAEVLVYSGELSGTLSASWVLPDAASGPGTLLSMAGGDVDSDGDLDLLINLSARPDGSSATLLLPGGPGE